MIRYALRCEDAHEFESWFRDSGSFDTLKAEGLVHCPQCGTSAVEKALMAPAVVTGREKAAAPVAAPETAPETPVPALVALADEPAQQLRTMLRQMRDHLVSHSRDVGTAFAEEARRIHDGEAEKEPIRGQASADEVRALLDDGIEVMPLPVFPDDRN